MIWVALAVIILAAGAWFLWWMLVADFTDAFDVFDVLDE